AVATVFLDRDRRVRRFTRAVHGLIELRSSDLGRPLSHFRVALQDETLMDDLDRVLASSEPAEAIARGNGDQWFLRRIVPYRTGDGNADGVVITFTDITRRHQAEQS